jgi:hypothetical protein
LFWLVSWDRDVTVVGDEVDDGNGAHGVAVVVDMADLNL